jgi:CheY-like chemotaxis protein
VSRILLVDDDEDTRAALKELLEIHGFDVSEAGDGKNALDHIVSSEQPALVILDLEMPVMSGAELLDVMSRYYRLSRVPVLVVSGSAQAAPEHEAVVGVLGKPCDVEKLLDTVRAHADAH